MTKRHILRIMATLDAAAFVRRGEFPRWPYPGDSQCSTNSWTYMILWAPEIEEEYEGRHGWWSYRMRSTWVGPHTLPWRLSGCGDEWRKRAAYVRTHGPEREAL